MATGVANHNVPTAVVDSTDSGELQEADAAAKTEDSVATEPRCLTRKISNGGSPSKPRASVTISPKSTASLKSTTSPTSGATLDSLYFFEDEVFRFDKRGRVKFGLVVETSETYSGDEGDDYDDVPRKGEIRVSWHPDGKEEIHPEHAVGLADRTIMPADVVRRLIPGKDTQHGYCREIKMRADVQIVGTNHVLRNVDTQRLCMTTNWQLDTAVCLDSWVGSIKAIDENIVLKTPYGARLEVSSSGLYGFKDINCLCRSGIFKNLTFYPGQVISGRLHSSEPIKMLTPDIPLRKNKKGKPVIGRYTVESINVESIWVRWQCKALSEDYDVNTHEVQQPKSCVVGEDLKRLKRLNLYESCMQQINDLNYLTLTYDDVPLRKPEWQKDQAIKFKLLYKQQREMATSLQLPNIALGAPAAGNSTHHDKFKKKLLDADGHLKLKKFLLKMEEIHKEKYQVSESKPDNHPNSTKALDLTDEVVCNDEWVSDEGKDDDLDDEDYYDAYDGESDESFLRDAEDARSATTTISTCSTPTPRNSPRNHLKRWQRNKQTDKKFKKIPSSSKDPTAMNFLIVGDKVVVESLLLYSSATVVWQDGSVESGIPSIHLYPIHHLDTHEFFPGDFVISGKEDSDVSYRDYGVIQSVDHKGRIARVKWFTTYTSAEEAKPTCNGETEVSVYDLKDHPDFQYRPGVMVIRVANFTGEDASCTAGQIIDNFPDGRVKVWWVDGHTSMCWPQDLFEVGQYDQTDVGGNESDDSWETESENSEVGCNSPKTMMADSQLLSNIEQACAAIAKLEEFFVKSPNLQNPEVKRKLLGVYKGCRYLDRLLNTSFFHENNFMGLIERVRKGGTQTVSERAQDRKNRLFSDTSIVSNHKSPSSEKHARQAIVAVNVGNKSAAECLAENYVGPKVLFNLCSPFKTTKCDSSTSTDDIGILCKQLPPVAETSPAVNLEEKEVLNSNVTESKIEDNTQSKQNSTNTKQNSTCDTKKIATPTGLQNSNPNQVKSLSDQNDESFKRILSSAILNIETAFEKTSHLKSAISGGIISQDDSGNYSRNENCDGSSTSCASPADLNNVEANSSLLCKANEDQKSVSCSSMELADDSAPEVVCVRLCSLLRDQLLKCISEIRLRYFKEEYFNLNLSDVVHIVERIAENDKDGANVMDYAEEGEEIYTIRTAATEEAETANDTNVSSNQDSGILTKSAKSAENEEDSDTASAAGLEIASVTSLSVPSENFQVLSTAPKAHKFHLTIFHPNNTQQYYKAVHREYRMLRSSLPPGVWVRVFEDRMDLVSVMIEGPKKTPYEDGMFLFDIQLGREYPKTPPLCQYISYCSDRLNPNLYEDGKVCVSLLGTWTGRDSEVWGPNSTLLQVIVSIQGLILVPEPYFNEAGYEKQKGTQQGIENSRMYNEMVIIKMVQATSKLLQSPPEMFRKEIMEYYKLNGMCMFQRIKGWIELSKAKQATSEQAEAISDPDNALPEFPLVPASRGFCLTLEGLLGPFHAKLNAINSTNLNDGASEAENAKQ